MRYWLVVLGLVLLPAGIWAQGPQEVVKQGQEVFEDNCAQCHRSNGQGLPGTFPALDGNPFVAGTPQPVIATVLNGRKGKVGQMPVWKDKLDDTKVAAVLTYVRQAWSNRASPVDPGKVAAVRGK